MDSHEVNLPAAVACDLCGHVYQSAGPTPACHGCALAADCSSPGCPMCGYDGVVGGSDLRSPRDEAHAPDASRVIPPGRRNRQDTQVSV